MRAYLKQVYICYFILLGGGATQAVSAPSFSQSSTATAPKEAKQLSGRGQKLEFVRGTTGQLVNQDDVILGFTEFTASDGVRLTVIYQDFDNPLQATEVFNKELARAAKIVKQGKKLDVNGKSVGERSQIVFPPLDSHEAIYAVLWTDGFKFHEIQSTNLQDILQLEKIYKY